MNHSEQCSDCGEMDRRSFLRTAGGAVAAGSLLGATGSLTAAGTENTSATKVKAFYDTLTDKQKETICFPFGHKLQSRVSANWHITKPELGDGFYTKEQQALAVEILKSITSEDGYKLLEEQMLEDSGGRDFHSIAMFGEPGKGPAQWTMTGRHLTLRADGNREDQIAFGGPTVYGHSESDPAQNLFHSQTKKVNEVFKALDANQAEKALQKTAPRENAVAIQGASGKFPGLSVSEMSADQKELVEGTLKHLLGPYEKQDSDEVMAILKASGGLDKLHFAFYKQGDLKNDNVWDIWRVEGPAFVWHFRGAPHVHAYINIGMLKTQQKQS